MKPRRFAFALSLVSILVWMVAGSLPAASQEPSADFGTAQSSPGNSPAVIFYADPALRADFWPLLFAALQRELDHAAPADGLPSAARFIVAGERSIDPGVSGFIVVHLKGRCDLPRQAWRPVGSHAPLGWVYQSEDRIQPFVFVDCGRIAQVLDPLTLGMSDGLGAYSMDTAIARVLVHEWIHISLQTAGHTEHGIRRPRLSAWDLTAEDDLPVSGAQ